MDFYLGVHRSAWMPLIDVPLFISANILRRLRTIPKAKRRMGFDSGGFSELDTHGCWTIDDHQLVALVRRVLDAGNEVDFAAIRDWMCEEYIRAKTGKTIREHQELTIESYANLRATAPDVPWLPVLQGWHPDDYEAHFEMYQRAGFDLRSAPPCRRRLGLSPTGHQGRRRRHQSMRRSWRPRPRVRDQGGGAQAVRPSHRERGLHDVELYRAQAKDEPLDMSRARTSDPARRRQPREELRQLHAVGDRVAPHANPARTGERNRDRTKPAR